MLEDEEIIENGAIGVLGEIRIFDKIFHVLE